MKYERNQYSEGFSICALIIAGFFLYWGISSIISWNVWTWWGFISTGIGIAILLSQIFALTNRSKLRNVVLREFKENPEATLEDISRNTGISRKDIQAIILDLKSSGQLIGKFNTTTGQIKHFSIPDKEYISEERAKFCSNCGTPVTKETAQYCAYCGAQIQLI